MDSPILTKVSDRKVLLSLVIPVYNEELVIEITINRVRQVLESMKIKYEIIVINDGSTDGTMEILLKAKKNDSLRILSIINNSGQMNAIRAGLEASNGEYVVTIDADLQDPPDAIPEMLKIISSSQNGSTEDTENTCDVVQAFRSDRESDTLWKRKSAAWYYYLIRKLTGISLTPHAADYRIMKRHVVEQLISLPEKNLVYRLLIPSLGFRVIYFPIIREERFAGKSKYTNRKMLSLAIDSIISFTNRPLRYLAFIGFFASAILFLGSIFTLLLYFYGNTLPGWPSLALLILSFNAFLFAGLGLVGEYVGRIYQLVQDRPRTLWHEIKGNP